MPMRRLLDSHVHIEGFDTLDVLIRQCVDAGVDGVLCVGGDIDSSMMALRAAGSFSRFFYPAVGVHPSNVLKTDLGEALEFFRNNLEKCVALGEVGLDYSYGSARPPEVRKRMREFLGAFLELAAEFGKPVSVHSRSAYRDTFDLMYGAGVKGVFHWYDGPLHTLRSVLDAGFYVSATPAVAYSKGIRDVMSVAPLERILVETDSPVYLRGLDRLSTPVDVVGVVEALAELKGLDIGEVARVTTGNAVQLFSL